MVVGGGFGGHAGFLLDALRARPAALSPLPVPRLAISSVGDEATLLGGLAHAPEAARGRAHARYADAHSPA